jgi:hypothetical protein
MIAKSNPMRASEIANPHSLIAVHPILPFNFAEGEVAVANCEIGMAAQLNTKQ